MGGASQKIFEENLLPLFRQLIRNACVNTGQRDSGHEDRSVETLQRFFGGYGLEGEVIHCVAERGNLILRVPGTDPTAPSLAFMGHMDVVPANKADWQVDPFAAEIRDGQVWGRGAVDMLCWTACQAVGFAEACKKVPGGRFRGDLVFMALADEEAAGRYGAQHLTEHHWNRVAVDYMVTELGGFFIGTDEGPAAFINLGEKGVAWLKLSTRGRAGHGSMPWNSDNAVLHVARAAQRLSAHHFPLRKHPVFQKMARAMGKGAWQKFCLENGLFYRSQLGELSARDPGMAKFLHTAGETTLSPNRIAAGEKINIIADRGELFVDCRFLPGSGKDDVLRMIKRVLGASLAEKFEYEFIDFFPSNLSSPDTPLMEATRSLFSQAHPDARLVDLFIGGVTDGRYWRAKGTTVYGFTLFDRDMTMNAYGERIHGRDERISLSSLEKGLWFFTELPGAFFSRV